jgi:hypothetical protein
VHDKDEFTKRLDETEKKYDREGGRKEGERGGGRDRVSFREIFSRRNGGDPLFRKKSDHS